MNTKMTKLQDIEESLTYSDYERTRETAFLLSGQKSLRSVNSKIGLDTETNNFKPDNLPRSRCILVMSVCLYFMTTTFGMVAALGVIYVELISSFQCPRSEAALVQSLYMGVSLVGGVFVERIITKYDIGVCILLAAAVGGVAMACGSLARDIYTVIVLVGLVTGLATSVLLMSASVIVNWTFVNNRKFALSILSLGFSLGQIVMPYITDALINEYHWEGCLLILSALTFMNCVPAGLVIYHSKQFFHKGNQTQTKGYFTLSSIASDSAFLVYMVTAFIFPGIGPVEQWFSVDLAVIKGFGIQAGATILSLNGIMGLVARVITSAILKRYPNTKPEVHISYNFILWAVAHLSIVESNTYWEMVLAMVLRGYSSGAVTAFLPSFQIELRGPEHFSQTLSISYLLYGTGQIIGGFLCGYSVDVTGSYNLIFYIATACFVYCGISMIILYWILKRRRDKDHVTLP